MWCFKTFVTGAGAGNLVAMLLDRVQKVQGGPEEGEPKEMWAGTQSLEKLWTLTEEGGGKGGISY